MIMPFYALFLTPQARLMLHAVTDRRIRNLIGRQIDGLTKEPTKKGKALVAELTGFRSLRAARYRVLYKVEKELIKAALQYTKGNVTQTAALLHISRDKLRYRISKYRLNGENSPRQQLE